MKVGGNRNSDQLAVELPSLFPNRPCTYTRSQEVDDKAGLWFRTGVYELCKNGCVCLVIPAKQLQRHVRVSQVLQHNKPVSVFRAALQRWRPSSDQTSPPEGPKALSVSSIE